VYAVDTFRNVPDGVVFLTEIARLLRDDHGGVLDSFALEVVSPRLQLIEDLLEAVFPEVNVNVLSAVRGHDAVSQRPQPSGDMLVRIEVRQKTPRDLLDVRIIGPPRAQLFGITPEEVADIVAWTGAEVGGAVYDSALADASMGINTTGDIVWPIYSAPLSIPRRNH
jgi:hypothetical protein